MIHVFPILCLILFIGFIEYRLKKHLDLIDKEIKDIEEKVNTINVSQDFIISYLNKVNE